MDFNENLTLWEKLASSLVGPEADHVRLAISEALCITKEVGYHMPPIDEMVKYARRKTGWLHCMRKLSYMMWDKLSFDNFLKNENV